MDEEMQTRKIKGHRTVSNQHDLDEALEYMGAKGLLDTDDTAETGHTIEIDPSGGTLSIRKVPHEDVNIVIDGGSGSVGVYVEAEVTVSGNVKVTLAHKAKGAILNSGVKVSFYDDAEATFADDAGGAIVSRTSRGQFTKGSITYELEDDHVFYSHSSSQWSAQLTVDELINRLTHQ